jgi:hypothetical protein
MQSITNEVKIARGARIAKWATLAGLGFLIAGLVVSWVFRDSPLLFLSFAFLLLGILVSSVGTMNMNRWVREPRADQALAMGLKGYDDRYRLYSYLLPAPHVLLCPVGLFVLTAMGQDGVVRYEGGKFHRKFSLGRVLRFMADEGMGRPLSVADAEVRALQELLDEDGAGEGVELRNIVVFYNPRAELSLVDPPRPVVDPKGLKKAIRKQRGKKIPTGQYRRLQELFDEAAS